MLYLFHIIVLVILHCTRQVIAKLWGQQPNFTKNVRIKNTDAMVSMGMILVPQPFCWGSPTFYCCWSGTDYPLYLKYIISIHLTKQLHIYCVFFKLCTSCYQQCSNQMKSIILLILTVVFSIWRCIKNVCQQWWLFNNDCCDLQLSDVTKLRLLFWLFWSRNP